MAKPRQTSKKTSKADVVANGDASEPCQAANDGSGTPDITLPTLAQDYLQNKDEVMEVLLKLTKALKDEREARQILRQELADITTRQTQIQQTMQQQASRLPDAVRDDLDRDIGEMLEGLDEQFADVAVKEEVEDLLRRMETLEDQVKDMKREQPIKHENDDTLVEDAEGNYLAHRAPSTELDFDMSDIIMKPA